MQSPKTHAMNTINQSNNTTEQAKILRYWRSVELFNARTIPAKDTTRITASTVLPWNKNKNQLLEEKQIVQNTKGSSNVTMVKRYTVYCGMYSMDAVRTLLEEKIGCDEDTEYKQPPSGKTCICSFEVTREGRPLLDSFSLSTCAWSVGRTINPGPNSEKWLNGYEYVSESITNAFIKEFDVQLHNNYGKTFREQGKKTGRILNFDDIENHTRRITLKLGLGDFISDVEIRIKEKNVSEKREYEVDDQDFINSFYINDLERVSKILEADGQSTIGKALQAYLMDETELDLTTRKDVRQAQTISHIFKQLSPNAFPAGRWASHIEKPLVLSQQLAVNTAMQQLSANAGLFAVNGPPGTGKTTLLRDIIAAVIVERGKRLAKFTNPTDAFVSSYSQFAIPNTNTRYLVKDWQPEFSGFEIVIASANNGAVENITQEIPALAAIDAAWHEYSDYFKEFATNLLGKEAWSLTAARLGKSENRKEFRDNFLWNNDKLEQRGFISYLESLANQNSTRDSAEEELNSDNENRHDSVISWSESVENFRRICQEEEAIRQERQAIFDDYKQMLKLENDIDSNRQAHSQQAQERERALKQVNQSHEVRKVTEKALQDARDEQIHHHKLRPGFWQIVFSLGKELQRWKEKNGSLEKNVETAKWKDTAARSEYSASEKALESIDQRIHILDLAYQKLKNDLALVNDKLTNAETVFGATFPSRRLWNKTDWDTAMEERELSSPWADPQWNEARTKVFLEALQLHKAFIQANAAVISENLRALSQILTGNLPVQTPAATINAAWRTLFFIVPVVSTTFASFDRLFKGLGKESLGWLMIDEAGQAAPQMAVGALWRAKRAIIVGDPLQLEPVISLPKSVQNILRQHYNVAETWVPENTSTQELADRTNTIGTTIQSAARSGYRTELWIGSPLRVHRRSDNPMFTISNKIAYDNLMIYGTPERESFITDFSGMWIDINTQNDQQNIGHWLPAEGEKVRSLLNRLHIIGVGKDNIFLITPFRDVAEKLTELFPEQEKNIGTIHTFQGKEAEVVILVLGGDPSKPGAKIWASKRPNLLNVAVSRAKRCLIVVGSKELWSGYPYFDVCANDLGSYTPLAP